MCTAITYKTKDFYFGRTLDVQCGYGEEVIITPRNFDFVFRAMDVPNPGYAIIGVAHAKNGYPLYYDAVNEKGLAVAGLNFVGTCAYQPYAEGKDNVAVYEFIPWILSQCATLSEAKQLLRRINIMDIKFCDDLDTASLHWIIADKSGAVTVESVAGGIKIYDNAPGVLTNNPDFEKQMFNLNNYMGLSPDAPKNMFSPELKLEKYSLGMGALGLPGDVSSMSRFVRATYVRLNSVSGDSETESVSQFFHILGTVEQVRGCVKIEEKECQITLYTVCCNTETGVYYYTTYNNPGITAVAMHNENLDGCRLIEYPMLNTPKIHMQN